jgi:hypothetical protein
MLAIFVAIICWQFAPQIQALISGSTKPAQTLRARESSVYYRRCLEARATGAAPIYRGQPGYREGLDGDLDGIACEPIRY